MQLETSPCLLWCNQIASSLAFSDLPDHERGEPLSRSLLATHFGPSSETLGCLVVEGALGGSLRARDGNALIARGLGKRDRDRWRIISGSEEESCLR